MTRGRAWEGSVSQALQAATATSWGDAALHAFTVQQKAQAEPENNAFGLCGCWTRWCARSALSGDVPCLTPLPCSSGEADFLLALASQRAGIPLDNSGKAVTCCYEQI